MKTWDSYQENHTRYDNVCPVDIGMGLICCYSDVTLVKRELVFYLFLSCIETPPWNSAVVYCKL